MKISFCYLAFLLLSVCQAAAQPRWNVSLKAGAGWTGVWQTRDSPYSIIDGFKERFVPNRGLLIGAQVNYRLSPRFGIDVGFEYQTMRDELQRSFDNGNPSWVVKPSPVYNSARRVQVPLQLRYQLSSRPKSVYVLVGVLAGYLQSVEIDIPGFRKYDVPFKLIDRSQLPRDLPRYQFPLLAGVGMSVGRHVAFELTYQYLKRPMEFLRYDPRFTTIGLTPSVSRMNQGLFLSAKYRFKKLY